jgi:hypothetical protein
MARADAISAALAAATGMIAEVDKLLNREDDDESTGDAAQPGGSWAQGEALASAAASRPPPRKARNGHVPGHVVERILRSRADTMELRRSAERLYNTSSISQYVFADRATDAILGDLIDEVLAEIGDLCDDYVDGVAAHELQ